MSSEDALYVLAHQNGIDIAKRLDNETVARVATYVSRLGGRINGEDGKSRAGGKKEASGLRQRLVRVAVVGLNIDQFPGLSEKHAQEAKVMAEKVFPALYVFENSARDVIVRVLDSRVGKDWWDDQKIVAGGLSREVARRIAAEEKEGWHSSRGTHPIQYVDLTDLPSIISAPHSWPHFEKIFPRQSWVSALFEDMNVSRRVVAHMNPLAEADIKQVEAGFQKWARHLKAIESELP